MLALVCFGIVASALAFVSLRSLELEKAKAAFQRVAQERFDELQSDLDLTVNNVVAVGAFCKASHPITQSSFNSFTTPLLADHDAGIKALEWVPRVSLSERAGFEKSVRASGLIRFEICDRLAQGQMVRAGDRPYYSPVLYVQPYVGNEIAIGYDLLADARRREALMRAESSGELAASERITLVQETSDQYGIVIVRPVFGDGGPHQKLMGFALGVLRIGDVVEKHGEKSGVDLALTDVSAGAEEQPLYPSTGNSARNPRSNPVQQPSAFTQYRRITVGGRTWQIAASPTRGAFPVSKGYSYAGSALCLLFTLLVAVYVAEMLNQRRQIEQVVEERTGALNSAILLLAQMHRGLEETEARYRRLVEDSPDAIVVERQGKIVLVNRAAVMLFGFDSAEDFAGHNLAEFVIPERRERARGIVGELYGREMRIDTRETRGLRRDGSVVDIEVSASSFTDAGLLAIQVILRDITQRKLDQAENARLIRAIEQVGDSIVITDVNANVVYVNPAFERVSGYSREEVVGKNPRILKSGRQSKEFYAALWEPLKNGESWSGRLINRAKHGRLFTEDATISPVVNAFGTVINYVAVKRDVTLELELQEQLHQSQKMDAIGRLAGGVAHDFNNMLMVIVSYADLLASGLEEGDPLLKHTDQILRAAQRSSALTRQLLAFSRKQVLSPQIVACNAIIEETSSMVRRLISENIELKCDLAANLWPVKADADQIVQVILNLCVNGRDAMPNGGSLVVATRNYQVDQGFVEISVSDTGIGISSELQAKLFEPFFTTKERGKGTGLGLATVYGIVQQSGGHIRVTSLPGQGATFSIYLPRCMEAAPSPESAMQKSFMARRGQVLVVEDEDALREAIAAHLRNHGYQVLAAANGIEALDVLARNPNISILITDLIMPRMGGRELVRVAQKGGFDFEVIFMSGYADQSSDEEETEFTAAFLQKPFTMNALLARMDEVKGRPEVNPLQGNLLAD